MNNLRTYSRKSNKVAGSIIILIVLVMIIIGIWAQNNFVITRNFVYADTDLPKSLVGYKILHISDICNTSNKILSKVKNTNPDIILLSGGYQDIDGNTSNTVKIVSDLCKIATVYYIYNTNDTSDCLEGTNAINITDQLVSLKSDITDAKELIEKAYGKDIINKALKGDEEATQYIQYISDELANEQYSTIKLCGINNMKDKSSNDIRNKSYSITGSNTEDFTIMLNGNLNNLETICGTNVDIVLVGGTFGKVSDTVPYSKGAYSHLGTEIFVSGGCGNYTSKRIANMPEIQLITLSDGTIKQNNPIENLLSLFIGDIGTIYDNDDGFNEYTYKYDDLYNMEYK